MWKKILLVFMCLLMLNTSIHLKRTEAAAAAAVLPTGITVAGGAYALGALAVGSVATYVGLEYGDRITEHAAMAWSNTTNLAKDSLYMSMQLASDTGSLVAGYATDFYDWLETKVSLLASIGTTVLARQTTNLHDKSDDVFEDTDLFVPITTAYPHVSLSITNNAGRDRLFHFDDTNYFQAINHNANLGLSSYKTLRIFTTSNALTIRLENPVLEYSAPGTTTAMLAPRQSMGILTGSTTHSGSISFSTNGLNVNEIRSMINQIYTVEQALEFMDYLNSIDVPAGIVEVGTASTFEAWQSAKTKLQETDLPAMRDAGMVIPTQDIVAHPASDPSRTLTYESEVGWALDGAAYYGDVVWTYPRAGHYVDVHGNVRVGTPVATGVAAGEVVDVYTGTPIQLTPSTGTGKPPSTTAINFSPLIISLLGLTEKFPFSIPWDFFRLVAYFNVQPQSPKFEVDVKRYVDLSSFGDNTEMNLKFNIDLQSFDLIAQIIRWGLLIVFDISLIVMLRRLTPD